MAAISVVLIAMVIAHSAAISLLPDIMIGTCVEMCSPNPISRAVLGLSRCPEGYTCRFNGCGHTCQPILAKKQIICPPLSCHTLCPNGYHLSVHDFCPNCVCLA